ncbi:MAG: ABC transporter permease [Proteobacteria bacterium]|nr:ABC transporter permease [Pseudomonadota bacterium]
MKFQLRKRETSLTGWKSLISPLMAVLLTLIISSAILLTLGYSPLSILYAFFLEPLSNKFSIAEVMMRTATLSLIALGLAIGFRANIWNIGAEGQYTFGAITGSVVALYFYEVEAWYIIPLMIIFGMLGGMLWAAIPAWLKTRYNTNEILTSLMLVYVSTFFLSYLVHGPLKDPEGFNFPQTRTFHDAATYPILWEETRLSITVLFLIVILPIVYLFLMRSYVGFQLKVAGFAPDAAKYSGFNDRRMVWISFLACGALAGLTGISEISSNSGQLTPVISPGYGFTAIIVAFLGRLNPVGILFAGALLALNFIGAENTQISLGLPVSIGDIFQGLILFCLLASDFFLHYKIIGIRQGKRV